MDFNVNNAENHVVIAPLHREIDEVMITALERRVETIMKDGQKNIIIDLQQCVSIDPSTLPLLKRMHEDCYSAGCSLVFTRIAPAVMAQIKADEADLVVNIAPTLVEAIDIINMEEIERELFNEE